jgi:hypothetical protein
MLKIVPVCGGSSDFTVEGSTWGRAGRRFRRIIFLVFFSPSGSAEVRELSEGKATAISGVDESSASAARSSGGGLVVEGIVISSVAVVSDRVERDRDSCQVKRLKETKIWIM